MRYRLIFSLVLLCFSPAAPAQVNIGIGIGLPGVNIGVNLPAYPDLVPVPGYPVYYDPDLGANYFFYDGMYWVYQDDNWYASDWYNGPWSLIDPIDVPLFVLRVPVRYYRRPPQYFGGWEADIAPHWDQHWGASWAQRRSGWDRWDRNSAPRPAPLPTYQRQYTGSRYPQPQQQQALQSKNYRYQPHDPTVRQHFQRQAPQAASPAAQGRPVATPQAPGPAPQGRPAAAPQQSAPRPENMQRPPQEGPRQEPAPHARTSPQTHQPPPEGNPGEHARHAPPAQNTPRPEASPHPQPNAQPHEAPHAAPPQGERPHPEPQRPEGRPEREEKK